MADAADSTANNSDLGITGLPAGLLDTTSPFAISAPQATSGNSVYATSAVTPTSTAYTPVQSPYALSSLPAQGFQGQRLTEEQAATYKPSVYSENYIDFTQPGAYTAALNLAKPTAQSISSYYTQNAQNPQNVADYASQYGLTVSDIANATGLSTQYLDSYLSGTSGLRSNMQGGVETRGVGTDNLLRGLSTNSPYAYNTTTPSDLAFANNITKNPNDVAYLAGKLGIQNASGVTGQQIADYLVNNKISQGDVTSALNTYHQQQAADAAAKAAADKALEAQKQTQAQAAAEAASKQAELTAQLQAQQQAAAQAEAQRQAEAQKADITAKHQQSAQASILNASGLGLSDAQANALAVKFINANDLNTNSSLNWSDPSSIQSFVNDWLYGTPSADASNNKGPQYTVDVEPLLDANTWETIPRLTSQQLQDRYNSFTAAQQADINKYYMDTYGKNLNDYAKSLPANVTVDAKLPPIMASNIDTGLTPRQNAELMSNGVNSAGFGSLLENAFEDGVLTKPDSFSDYKTLSNQISSFLDPNYKPQYAQDSDFVNGLRVALEKGAAPLGLGTYVEAAVRTLGNDKSYSQNLDAINKEIYNWTRDNPWVSGLSESLGSVLGTAMGGSPLGLLSTAYNMFTNPAFTDVDPVALNEVRKFTPSDYMMPDFLSSQTNKLGPPAISQNAVGEKTGYWDNPYTVGDDRIPVAGGDINNYNEYQKLNTPVEYNPAFDYAEYNKTGQTQYSQSYLDSLLAYGTDPNATTPAGTQKIDAIDWATASPSDYEYSYDGGKTWSTQVPAGISAISNTIGAGSSDPWSGSSWDFGSITDNLSNWFDAANSWVDWNNNWFDDSGSWDWWDVPWWSGKEGGTIPNPDDEYLNPQSPYKIK